MGFVSSVYLRRSSPVFLWLLRAFVPKLCFESCQGLGSFLKKRLSNISSAMHNPHNLHAAWDGSIENEVVLHRRVPKIRRNVRPGSAKILVFSKQHEMFFQGINKLRSCSQVFRGDIAPDFSQIFCCPDREL